MRCEASHEGKDEYVCVANRLFLVVINLKVINLRQDGEACVSVGPSIVENVHGCKKAGWRVSYSICSKNFAMIKVALASSIFAYKNGYEKFRLRRNCCGNDMHVQFRNHVNLCLKH